MKEPVSPIRDERGLTLIEFMMAAAVTGVVFMVLYSILNYALGSYEIGQLRSAAVQGGRVTVSRILNDLKYTDDIYVAEDERIYFRRQKEGSGAPQNIDYNYDSGTGVLTRQVSDFAGVHVFADDIASFTFKFRDSGYLILSTPVAEAHKIRYIELEMRLQHRDYEVTLRNLAVLENPLPVPYP